MYHLHTEARAIRLHPSNNMKEHLAFLDQQSELMEEGRKRISEETKAAFHAVYPGGWPRRLSPEDQTKSDEILAENQRKLDELFKKHTPPWDDGDY